MRPIRNPAKPPPRQRAPRLPGPGGPCLGLPAERVIAGPPARPLHRRAPALRGRPGRTRAHLGESRARTRCAPSPPGEARAPPPPVREAADSPGS